MKRVAALFVKPGRGDGTFAEMRVFRLPLGKLAQQGEIADGFALLPTRKAGRVEPVFLGNEINGSLDVLVAK